MTDRDIVRKRQKPPIVIVTAILQIVFGTLSVCTPVFAMSGLPEMMLKWNDDLQASLPRPKGQPQISQLKIQKDIHDRIPWLYTFERMQHGSSLVLCVMMIAGGIGLLYMHRWARWVTLSWAVLSLGYTITITTLTLVYVIPVTMEVTSQIFEEMPDPPPGQPDIRPMMRSMMQSVGPLASIGPLIGALIPIAYAVVVLVFMLLPSVVQAFRDRDKPLPEEDRWERKRKTIQDETEDQPPDDRIQRNSNP